MPRLTRRDLEWTIREAMKSMAPRMFRELTESGKLEKVIQTRADLIEENYEESSSQIKWEHLRKDWKDPLEQMRSLTMAYNNAWNEALQTGIEFDEEPPSEERNEDEDPYPA